MCVCVWLSTRTGPTDRPGLMYLRGKGHSCLLPPHEGGPKPWGQSGKMTFLAESDRSRLPTQTKRKFYGRKLDLKSNQAPREKAGQGLGQSGWAEGRQASGEPRRAASAFSPLPVEPGHCLTLGEGSRPQDQTGSQG